MAAAVATGTPVAQPVAAPKVATVATESEAIESSFADALAAMPAPAENDAIEGEPVEAEAAPEPEAEPVAAPKGKAKESELFSDAALATKEGIAAARDHLKERQRGMDRADIKFKDRDAKITHKIEEFKAHREQFRVFAQAVNSDLELLRRGSPDQKLQAIGRLTGGDPLKEWESISISALGGKKKTETPELVEIRAELQAMRQEREAERQRGGEAQKQQFVAHRKQEIYGHANNPAEFPAIARFLPSKPHEVVDYIVDIKARAMEGGAPIDDATAIRQLETELREQLGITAPSAAAESGMGAGATQVANPGKPPQRPVGKSLTPGLTARSGGAVRELTEQERIAELADDPDFLRSVIPGWG